MKLLSFQNTIRIAAKLIIVTTAFLLFAGSPVPAAVSEGTDGTAGVSEISETTEITENDETEDEVSGSDIDPIDQFLSKSAFVGNSISVGLTMYNDYKGKVPLGNSTMLTRQSYSFNNDRASNTNFLPRLNGVPMRAKDAIAESGVRYAFICMGTNDLVGSAGVENAVKNFKEYLSEIIEENPDITIFVESCTPSRPGSNVINSKVLAFNSYMKDYCDSMPDMYYIDITTPMCDAEGFLQAGFASDGSVHLSNSAYAIWADTVRAYIAQYLEMKKEEIRRQNELEREEARANYEENMRDMEEKKQEAFEERMAQVRAEEEALEAQRRYDLLNVPDPATLYRRLSESLKG